MLCVVMNVDDVDGSRFHFIYKKQLENKMGGV